MSMLPLKPQYLRVRNWEKFQHYKDRRPLWIKSYVEILDDYDLIGLPSTVQLVWFKVLLVAARLENKVPNDPKYVASLMHLDTRIVAAAFTSLVDKRFLEVWTEEHATDLLDDPVPREETDRTEKEEQDQGLDLPAMNILPVLKAPVEPHTLGAGRDAAFALLLTRVVGQDQATPKVLWGFCKKLPADRIEGVAELFAARCVNPGVAVNALKDAVRGYELEVSA